MKIEDILVVSDLDGTLVPISQQISVKNIEAIRRFRDLGGGFTIATGRSPLSAGHFLSQLGVEAPIIANNGAVLYDATSKKTIWHKPLPPNFRAIVRQTKETFPSIGIEVITAQDEYYLVSHSELLCGVNTVSGFSYKECDVDDLPDDSCKVLFIMHPHEFDAVVNEILSHHYAGVDFVKSGGDCFEMMAEQINKGYPLGELAKACGKAVRGIVAVGDYYNDIEMLREATLGVTLENAPEDIKQKADMVVPSCEDDGVAYLLEYLIENHEIL